MHLAPLLLFFGVSLAQRPGDITLCDYYAQQKYGSSSKENQFRMVQDIVSLAFIGNASDLNGTADIPGIFTPGVQESQPVDLMPWFDGSKDTTNVKNKKSAVNWLDDGGKQPLHDYLNNKTSSVELKNSTNQYRLFHNFFATFANMFDCSDPPSPVPSNGERVSVAYAHKYMKLDYHQLAYFIDQITNSARYWGFSYSDAQSQNKRMNNDYNSNCAPAQKTSTNTPAQFLSICHSDDCPLAVPSNNCTPYQDLQPRATVAIQPQATLAKDNGDSRALSHGAIAGITVGVVVVFAALVGALLLFYRKYQQALAPAPEAKKDDYAELYSNCGSLQAPAELADVPIVEMEQHSALAPINVIPVELGSPDRGESPPPMYEAEQQPARGPNPAEQGS